MGRFTLRLNRQSLQHLAQSLDQTGSSLQDAVGKMETTLPLQKGREWQEDWF